MKTKIFVTGIILAVLLISGCTSSGPSGNSIETTTTGAQTPRAAFEGYKAALLNSNLEDFKKYVTSDLVSQMEQDVEGGLTQEKFAQIAALMNVFGTPLEDVVVESENISGNSATWIVSDKGDPNNTGTIEFIKESGGWKVKKEAWATGL